MADIDRFLARVVPWPSAALSGFINIHWPGDKGWPGRAFQTHQAAVGFVNGMMRRPLDLFVCMSLQSQSYPPKTDARGREKRSAMRAILNSMALRSFWLDVDTKDGKFKDTTHALTEFGVWRRKVGLPLPSLVLLTGSGGFHVHWVLDTPISVDVWRPVMAAIVNACQKEGFNADIGRSRAPDQVLRIPGTLNHKHNPPVAARIVADNPDVTLAEIEQAMVPYKDTELRVRVTPQPVIVGKLGKPSAVFAGVPLPPRLDAGLDTYVPTIEDVAEECPFIDATLQLGGATHSEPLWRESLRIASFVQEGEEVAHDLSNQHPGYSERETDEKYANVLQYQKQYGWPQCQKIHDEGGVECKQCPHLLKGKSPLNFAKPLIKAAAAVATAAAVASAPVPTTAQFLPAGYGQHPNRHVYKLVQNPDDPKASAVPQDVLPLPLFNIRVFDKSDEGGHYSIAFDCEITPTRVRHVQLTYSELGDARKMVDRLGQQGLLIDHNQSRLMKDLMVAFTQQLKHAKAVLFDCAPYGWSKNKDGKEDAFSYARMRWNGTIDTPVLPLDPGIDDDYMPRGDPTIARAACNLITDQRMPQLNAVLGASLGAPAMVFTGHNGCVLHPWSEDSGTGKTAALSVAQSFWGTTGKMSQLGDTPNAINAILGMLRNMPAIYDEIRKANDKKLLDLIMQIAQGKTKQRLNRASQLADVHTWHTLLITASNSSLHDYISTHDTSTVAGINRVFEYEVPRNMTGLGLIDHTKAQRMLGELQGNFGHAGLECAKYFGKNAEKVRDVVARVGDSINSKVGGTTDDRFWIAMVTVTLVGSMIGNKLGVVDIDVDQLEGFMREQLQQQRGERKRSTSNLSNPDNIARYLTNFINSHLDQMLKSKHVFMGTGKRPAKFDVGGHNGHDLRRGVVIRAATEDNVAILSLKAMGAWASKEYGLSRVQIERTVKERITAARITKADLGHGTSLSTAREDVIWLDLNQMPGFLDFN